MQLAQPVLRLPQASAWGARGGSPLRRRGVFGAPTQSVDEWK